MLINFVLSKDLGSKIFKDIFQRFRAYDRRLFKIVVSESPVDNADIYHYHRPHLEDDFCKPAVATVHHDLEDMDPWMNHEKFLKAYENMDKVICLNTKQEKLLNSLGIEQTIVIPHGYDIKLFNNSVRPAFDTKINVGMISRRYLRRVKGEADLLTICRGLDVGSVKFTLVGQDRAIDADMLRSYGFEVDFYLQLPYRLFGQLYSTLDYLMILSHFEGGPANVPEALASGVPIISTNCGMVSDVVISGENGIIMTGDVRSDLVEIKAAFNKNSGLFEKLQKNAMENHAAITWERNIHLHVTLYKELVSELDTVALI